MGLGEEPSMPDENTNDDIPPGFTLLHTLRGHSSWIARIAWSPDGKILASPSGDQTIRLWDGQIGQLLRTLKGHSGVVSSVSWSPDGKTLASSSYDQTIRLWDVQSGRTLRALEGHSNNVHSIAWSPDGKTLASSSGDKTIRLWDVQAGRSLRTLEGHSNSVYSVAWSPDGKTLVSSSQDQTIHLWNPDTGLQTSILEGHTSTVRRVSFSYDGSLLASKSGDGTIRLWRTDTRETVAILKESASDKWPPSLAFHPSAPILATLGEEDTVILIWDLDFATLLGTAPPTPSFHYTNAKVVLVGDSGVGKSGLGLVLTGQPFVPTESTHGRHVWTFESREVELDSIRKETRETLLWDLAG
jgi:WD40 repeat protein